MRAYSLLFLGACLFVNSSVLAQPGQAAQPAPEETTRANSVTGTSPSLNGGYIIGPLDRLSISVWKEPELSRLVSVRPDGKISLPLVGDIQAAGLSPTALAAVIEKEMKRYIANPTTAVIVEEARSQRVYVLGEVARPGTFPLVPGMRVLQALATAGGFREFARVKKIFILRSKNGISVKFRFNYKQVIDGKAHDQNIILENGDSIIVP